MSEYRLLLGDCLDVLPTLPAASVDAVVTDPPYGVEIGVRKDKRRCTGHLGKAAYASYDDTHDNLLSLIIPRLTVALSLATRGAVFSGPHVQDFPKAQAIGGIFVPNAVGRNRWGFTQFLPVLFYGTAPDLNKGSRPTVLKSTALAEKNGHPCPKPLDWMVWLVERTTRPGETVLDPFAGSGTTGVACLMTGRNFIGIEIDPTYHAIAERRLAAACKERALFA